ncbi:DUF2164 domain-containing protein [Congregibacter sp.]|uniref:DUF2164 domain-containing protein n=1 Tax=Congregibacter sp. TaxID=2744308 RepID=UPI003F6AC202
MDELTLSKDAQEALVEKLKAYFSEELDQTIGAFDAVFLIEFLSAELGPHFYNQGLQDAHVLFAERAEELGYLIQDLEKPEKK